MNTLHPTVRVKKLRDDAVIPVKAHATDAAYDLCTMEDVTLMPGEWKMVGSGLAIAIPAGYCGKVYPRSGLGCKGLVLKNQTGIIDSSYRGEIKLTLFNNNPTHVWRHSTGPLFGTEMTELVPNTEGIIHVHKGDRVAQMCIELVPDSTLVEVEELDETERGAGGFGSSGISGGPRIWTDCAHAEIHGFPPVDTPDWVGTLSMWCPVKQIHHCEHCERYEKGEPKKVRDDADWGL